MTITKSWMMEMIMPKVMKYSKIKMGRLTMIRKRLMRVKMEWRKIIMLLRMMKRTVEMIKPHVVEMRKRNHQVMKIRMEMEMMIMTRIRMMIIIKMMEMRMQKMIKILNPSMLAWMRMKWQQLKMMMMLKMRISMKMVRMKMNMEMMVVNHLICKNATENKAAMTIKTMMEIMMMMMTKMRLNLMNYLKSTNKMMLSQANNTIIDHK